MFLYKNSKTKLFVWWVTGIFLLGGILLSCDNTLDPLNEEVGIFSIYGALDLDDSTHYIRVRDLNAPFTAEATRKIDAEVTFENLDLGTSLTLQGERKEYDGMYLHNFLINGEIQPDTEYRITARRSDGATTSVSVTTPVRSQVLAAPIDQNCYTPIEVEFEPLKSGTISYFVAYSYLNDLRIPVQGVLKSEENSSERVSFTFTPIDLVSRLINQSGNLNCSDMDNEIFYLYYTHYSSGFYEKIMNDPFDILQSTQRLGSLYQDVFEIPIDTSRVCPQDC
ncbi:hypothetical protein [Gracilimonas sp. BCB1]|uniref:hypothetical protein n=1 Tax=Gracilimonas sp. BCB1 TaxID=3152362 RepID=UPI0032D994FE